MAPIGDTAAGQQSWNNASLIAAARNALPRLLATLDAERAKVKVLEDDYRRESLMAQGKFEEATRLLRMGPTDDGSFEAVIATPIFRIFCGLFVALFQRSGAKNYIDQHVHTDEIGELLITIQKVTGKTANQLRQDAERDLSAERATLDALAERVRQAEEVNRWVPVAERLPGGYRKVLALNARGEMRVDVVLTHTDALHMGYVAWRELPDVPPDFTPVKPSGSWRDAIGCSPVPPGTPPAEVRIRAMRDGGTPTTDAGAAGGEE